MFSRHRVRGAALVLLFAAGCAASATDPAPLPPPTVTVSLPVEREVAEYVDFTGRTEAPSAVDIRARVTGYLIKIPFVEGTDVKAGDLLFEIDPRPFKAQVDQASADVALKKAALTLAVADNARAKRLGAGNIAAISEQERESYQAKEDQAKASLAASQAQLESAQINLDFTRVTSPISGRISRYYLTSGNLVNSDSTLLTTVVSEDPMYAYFNADEVTMLSVTRRLMSAQADLLKTKVFPVYMGLADETGFPHRGYVDFANNVVTSSTGTLTIRGVFPNPASALGRRLLRPGMFVRIRLPISRPRPSLLVSDRAIGSDQGSKFVYVVDPANTVQYQSVVTGPLHGAGRDVPRDGGRRIHVVREMRSRASKRSSRTSSPRRWATTGPS